MFGPLLSRVISALPVSPPPQGSPVKHFNKLSWRSSGGRSVTPVSSFFSILLLASARPFFPGFQVVAGAEGCLPLHGFDHLSRLGPALFRESFRRRGSPLTGLRAWLMFFSTVLPCAAALPGLRSFLRMGPPLTHRRDHPSTHSKADAG